MIISYVTNANQYLVVNTNIFIHIHLGSTSQMQVAKCRVRRAQ